MVPAAAAAAAALSLFYPQLAAAADGLIHFGDNGQRCVCVCLIYSTGWISTKFGMGHLLGPVGKLEILFLG